MGECGGEVGRYGESGGDRGRVNSGAGRYMSARAEWLLTTEGYRSRGRIYKGKPLDQYKLQPAPLLTNRNPYEGGERGGGWVWQNFPADICFNPLHFW